MVKADKLLKLFTTVKVGGFQLPHRVVLAPMTRFRADVSTAAPRPMVAEYYEQRASGAGLLITEATSIHEDAAPYLGCPGIYSEEQIAAWSKVSERVHGKGAKIFMQLWHLGRTVRRALIPGNKQAVSSSATPMKEDRTPYTDACGGIVPEGESPRALTLEEIPEIIGQFRQASANAIRAGFDGVELEGCGGYLIDQFLKDKVNKRQDAYGGSIDNRCRFTLELIAAVSKEIGEPKTALRLSPFGTYHDMDDSNPVALSVHLLRELSRRHPDLAYVHTTDFLGNTPEEQRARELRELRQAWIGKYILNRGGHSRAQAIEELEKDQADLFAFGRKFLANPDLPERLKKDLPLNEPDYPTLYTREAKGYTDYPFYNPTSK